MQLDERLVFFDSVDKCMLLMPILETEAEKFFDFLKTAETSAPDYSEAVHRFPKDLLLKYVFHTSYSGYWPEKALAWLIGDNALLPLFKDELEELIDKKAMPQSTRQKAREIMRSLRNTK